MRSAIRAATRPGPGRRRNRAEFSRRSWIENCRVAGDRVLLGETGVALGGRRRALPTTDELAWPRTPGARVPSWKPFEDAEAARTAFEAWDRGRARLAGALAPGMGLEVRSRPVSAKETGSSMVQGG